MTEETDFQTYLYVSINEFKIFLLDKKKIKNLYKNHKKLINNFNFVDFKDLSRFLDDNIFQIEKLTGIFVENIILIIEYNKNFTVKLGSKKKNSENRINKKSLENTLVELKNLVNENYQDKTVMHILLENYLVEEKKYATYQEDIKNDHLCLEVSFITLSNNIALEFNKVLQKYQIEITKYLDGNYIKNFFIESDLELSVKAYKLCNGYNSNEVLLIPKNIENKGFFEKFFNFFS